MKDISPLEGEKGKYEGRRALITGITGQDGSYLAELLLNKGYEVHGLIRRSSSFSTGRISHLYKDRHDNEAKLFLHYGDLTDSTNLMHIISCTQPEEIYNLGAMSHVKVSFEMSEYTAETCGLGCLRLLNAIRSCGLENKCRLYQASTSELFGNTREFPQSESTPFCPCSPYGISKQFAYWTVVNYRHAYGMFLTNGILFNHESPRRGKTFVTSKIVCAACRIKRGIEHCLYIGNLESERDWGHAKDYVRGMWMMLQHEKCDDFVLATGKCSTVRSVIEKAFSLAGTSIKWKGTRGSIDEIGVDKEDESKVLIRIDPEYFRPTEVNKLVGDASKAKRILGWKPEVTLDELLKEMVEHEMKELESEIRNRREFF